MIYPTISSRSHLYGSYWRSEPDTSDGKHILTWMAKQTLKRKSYCQIWSILPGSCLTSFDIIQGTQYRIFQTCIMARVARIITPDYPHHITKEAIDTILWWRVWRIPEHVWCRLCRVRYCVLEMKFIFYRETFNSSREKDFGKSTGMMMAMGSPRWMVIISASRRKRTLETKAS